MKMAKDKIHPCSKCGEKEKLFVCTANKHSWVVCGKCGTDSALAENKKDAVFLWNNGILAKEVL